MWGLVLVLATASPSPLVCTSDIQDDDDCQWDRIDWCGNMVGRASCPQTCGHACTFCNDEVLQNEAADCADLQSYDNLSHFEDLCRSAYVDIGDYFEPNHVAYCTCTCKQFWADATTTTITVSTTTTTTTTTTPSSKSTSTAVPIALGVTAAVLVTAAAGGWWYSHRRKTRYESTPNWL